MHMAAGSWFRVCASHDLRVLSPYAPAQDSTYKYFEVIMVDPAHAAIRNVSVQRQGEGHGLVAARKGQGGSVGHLNHSADGGSNDRRAAQFDQADS